MEVTLDQEAFVFALAYSPHLSSSVFLGMVYELLRYCFVLDDSTSAFDLFFEICGHIVRGHVPPLIQRFFSTF